MKRRTVFSFATLTLLITGAALYAGPLNPPAGPVSSSYKTLSEAEPRIAINATNTPGDASAVHVISQPGSYYLTSDVTAPTGKAGIKLAAVGVTLDLNGFTLRGQAGSTYGVDETAVPPGHITVRNGAITGFGSGGLKLGTYTTSRQRLVENLHVSGTNGTGIGTGYSAVIRNCTVIGFTFAGIYGSDGSIIEGCTVRDATGIGILTTTNSVVRSCATYVCGTGIGAGAGSTIEGCSASNCTGTGIGGGGVISRCTAQNNETGISVSEGGTIEHCVATNNTRYGLRADARGIISNCTSRQAATAFASIYLGGTDSVAQYNNCSGGAVGIQALVAGNLIIGNRCTGSAGNYSLVAGNRYGPMIDITAAGTPAVNGNAAASSLSSTDPYANFSY